MQPAQSHPGRCLPAGQTQHTLSPTVVTPEGTLTTRSYVLLDEVGRGATGTVWRARACATGREYAVKILNVTQSEEPRAVARFLQERAILLQLRHQNVVAVHDLLTTGDGSLAIVLDLVTGGSLRGLLRQRGTLPPAEAAALLAEVADGLSAAHAAGIVHRDLKPDNILLAPLLDGGLRARLTDFGIARIVAGPHLTTTGAVLGTPNYMAPEVIEGEPAHPAADVYALGIVLYELLTGRPPFDDGCDTAILVKHTREAARPVTGMPARIWALIQTCLHRAPARRPAAATLVTTLRALAVECAGTPAIPPDQARGTNVLAEPSGPGGVPVPVRGSIGTLGKAPRPRAGLDDALRSPFDQPTHVRPATPPPAPPAGTRRRTRTMVTAAAVTVVLALAIGGWVATRSLGGDRPSKRAALPNAGASPGSAVAPSAGGSRTAGGSSPPTEAAAQLGSADASVAPGSARPSGPAAQQGLPTATQAVPPNFTCAQDYRWSVGHPVLGKACQSTVGALQVLGRLQATPGIKATATVIVQDADSGTAVAGPNTCKDLVFTETTYEHTCGPFTLDLPHGHRYVTLLSWMYPDTDFLPGGVIEGEVFTW